MKLCSSQPNIERMRLGQSLSLKTAVQIHHTPRKASIACPSIQTLDICNGAHDEPAGDGGPAIQTHILIQRSPLRSARRDSLRDAELDTSSRSPPSTNTIRDGASQRHISALLARGAAPRG
ncbi:hypothetical protein NPX13_g3796 [Xylaria arbuscula]|uniref:Uncharacterized protein n=1 Tax=Xylaria arbuscula TaxID=114810 RepID=A0A9W8NHK2_9PEZI|nr:hypothetical protein NPX13_g3796 [Xylaria arbuscula]